MHADADEDCDWTSSREATHVVIEAEREKEREKYLLCAWMRRLDDQ